MDLTDAQRQYVASWVRRFVAPEIGTTAIPKELLSLIFRELSRQEEAERKIRDRRGRWEWPYSQAALDGTLYVPRVDVAVQSWAKSLGVEKRASAWPDNRPFAICLTHDVDLVSRRTTSIRFIAELAGRLWKIPDMRLKYFTSKLLRHIAKYLAGPILRFRREDEYHCFDSCMEIEAKFGFTSTFFFFAEHLPVPHVWDCGYSHSDRVVFYGSNMTVREMMRKMLKRGWHIGLHGSYLSAIRLDALMSERKQLEQSTGMPISAIRHHYLHYDTWKTPALHQQAGLKVDSTMGFNRNVGFRSGTAFPHYCWDHEQDRSTDVLEVDLQVMDGALLGFPGFECDARLAVEYAVKIMDNVAAVGGCLTLNWHPSWFGRQYYAEVYQAILKEAAKRNAWGCSLTDLCEYTNLGYGV